MSGTLTANQRDAVQSKILELFGEKRPEDFVRIGKYLNELDKKYHEIISSPEIINSGRIISYPQVWRTLYLSLNYPAAFKEYAEDICKDTLQLKDDPDFQEKMKNIYENMMGSDSNAPNGQDFDKVTAVKGMLGGIVGYKADVAEKIIKALQQILPKISDPKVVAVCDELAECTIGFGPYVAAGLAVGYIAYEGIKAIYEYNTGKITGARAAKRLIDAFITTLGGLGGGAAGAAFGAIGGPIGMIIGGVGGSIGGTLIAAALVDYVTQKVFNIPKDEALEAAYNFFGVSPRSTNDEINAAWRRACLASHPDRGGSEGDFVVVQAHMNIIKQARIEAEGGIYGLTSWFEMIKWKATDKQVSAGIKMLMAAPST